MKLLALINREKWPAYIATAKIFPLSKVESEYPSKDRIRTIAILPAVMKLMETIVLNKMSEINFNFSNPMDNFYTNSKILRKQFLLIVSE